MIHVMTSMIGRGTGGVIVIMTVTPTVTTTIVRTEERKVATVATTTLLKDPLHIIVQGTLQEEAKGQRGKKANPQWTGGLGPDLQREDLQEDLHPDTPLTGPSRGTDHHPGIDLRQGEDQTTEEEDQEPESLTPEPPRQDSRSGRRSHSRRRSYDRKSSYDRKRGHSRSPSYHHQTKKDRSQSHSPVSSAREEEEDPNRTRSLSARPGEMVNPHPDQTGLEGLVDRENYERYCKDFLDGDLIVGVSPVDAGDEKRIEEELKTRFPPGRTIERATIQHHTLRDFLENEMNMNDKTMDDVTNAAAFTFRVDNTLYVAFNDTKGKKTLYAWCKQLNRNLPRGAEKRKLKQWIPEQAKERFSYFKKNQFRIKAEALELARQNNCANKADSRIIYDKKRYDVKLVVRTDPQDPFVEVNYAAENMNNIPLINLDKISKFTNVDTVSIPRTREVIEKPSNNMPAPRGRSRTENSRNASSRNTGNQTLPASQAMTQTQSQIQLIPKSSDTTRPILPTGTIPKLDQNGMPKVSLRPKITNQHQKGNKKDNSYPLPLPTLDVINGRMKENEKAARMDDLRMEGAGIAEVEDITDKPDDEDNKLPKNQKRGGRRSKLAIQGAQNNNTVTQAWSAVAAKAALAPASRAESLGQKRALKSDEKPKPNSKKQNDEVSPGSKKLGREKSPYSKMLEMGDAWFDVVDEVPPTEDKPKPDYFVHYPENAEFKIYTKKQISLPPLKYEFRNYDSLRHKPILNKDRWESEMEIWRNKRDDELMEEEDKQKLRRERVEKNRLKIIDKEIRKAEAKTEKQKAAEDKLKQQSVASKAERDRKSAENSVKKEQELETENIERLRKEGGLAEHQEFLKISANQKWEKTIDEEHKRMARIKEQEKLEHQQEARDKLTYIQELNNSKSLKEIMNGANNFRITQLGGDPSVVTLTMTSDTPSEKSKPTPEEEKKAKLLKRKQNKKDKKEMQEKEDGWNKVEYTKTSPPKGLKSPGDLQPPPPPPSTPTT